MYPQQRTFKSILFVVFVAVLCIFCIPIISARKLDNNRNDLHDNGTGSDGHFASTGKDNTQFDSDTAATYYTAKRNIRSLLMTPKDNPQKLHSKIPLTLELVDFLLEYENDDRIKRFDDYGHMRFGKRGGEEQFDDYGHMRFGRSV